MDPLYTVELFGGLRVVAHFDPVGDTSVHTVTRFRTHQTGSLLAYLAHNAGKKCSREVLSDMFWPEASIKSGRSRLSMALSSLRSQLEPPGVSQGSILLADQNRVGVSRLVTTDTALFEAAIDAAERHDCDEQRRKTLLEKAVHLFDKRLMPGYYDPWIVEEQERLADRARTSLLYLAHSAEEKGGIEAAISYAHRAIAVSAGLCEDAEDVLNRLTLRVGKGARPVVDQVVAQKGNMKAPTFIRRETKQFRKPAPLSKLVHPSMSAAAETLADQKADLPVLPVPLTRFFGRDSEYRALTSAITDQGIRLVTLTGAGGTGKSRLARESALRWRQASFVSDGAVWLDQFPVLLSRPSDIYLIDLATETDPLRLPLRVGAAVNIAVDDLSLTGDPAGIGSLSPFIRAFEAKQAPLLILDNIEHLLPSAADWIEGLLEHIPHMTCLATSRVRLRIPGENEIQIMPLPTPPMRSVDRPGCSNYTGGLPVYDQSGSYLLQPESILRDWPSVALFVDRAQTARPGFSLTNHNAADVVALVKYLEGLPLSLELAAARAQVMTPAQMLRQLPANRFDLLTSRSRGAAGNTRRTGRHSSLRETIAWSVSLLPADLQSFYAQMSVFRGGWNDEAAEIVSANPLALDALAVLSDASLIRVDTAADNNDEILRFTMLESLREFAATLLDYANDRGEDALTVAPHPAYAAAAERHGYYFANLVAQAAPHLQGADSARYLEVIASENENIKAAIGWATQHDDGEVTQAALVFAADLGPYWYKTGRVQEGRSLLRAMMARSVRRTYRSGDAAVVAPKIARAVNSLGALAMQQRDFKDALRWYRTALFLERHGPAATDAPGGNLVGGDRTKYIRRRASVLNNFAIVKKMLFDQVGAVRAYQESLALWRELGETVFVGSVLSNLGNIAINLGHWDAATEYVTEAIGIFRAANNTRNEAVALNNLAEISYRRGEFREAGSLYRQSLRIFHLQKDITETAKILFQLGLIVAQYENVVDRGEQMLQVAWAVLNESGASVSDADKATALRTIGDSWMRPMAVSGDLLAALDTLTLSVLSENRFASASGSAASRPPSAPPPVLEENHHRPATPDTDKYLAGS